MTSKTSWQSSDITAVVAFYVGATGGFLLSALFTTTSAVARLSLRTAERLSVMAVVLRGMQ